MTASNSGASPRPAPSLTADVVDAASRPRLDPGSSMFSFNTVDSPTPTAAGRHSLDRKEPPTLPPEAVWQELARHGGLSQRRVVASPGRDATHRSWGCDSAVCRGHCVRRAALTTARPQYLPRD